MKNRSTALRSSRERRVDLWTGIAGTNRKISARRNDQNSQVVAPKRCPKQKSAKRNEQAIHKLGEEGKRAEQQRGPQGGLSRSAINRGNAD